MPPKGHFLKAAPRSHRGSLHGLAQGFPEQATESEGGRYAHAAHVGVAVQCRETEHFAHGVEVRHVPSVLEADAKPIVHRDAGETHHRNPVMLDGIEGGARNRARHVTTPEGVPAGLLRFVIGVDCGTESRRVDGDALGEVGECRAADVGGFSTTRQRTSS